MRRAGLIDCLTVYGSIGGVDVNTAEPAVLAASGVDAGAIAAIQAQRASGQSNQDMMGFAQSMGVAAGLRAGGNAIVTFVPRRGCVCRTENSPTCGGPWERK